MNVNPLTDSLSAFITHWRNVSTITQLVGHVVVSVTSNAPEWKRKLSLSVPVHEWIRCTPVKLDLRYERSPLHHLESEFGVMCDRC